MNVMGVKKQMITNMAKTEDVNFQQLQNHSADGVVNPTRQKIYVDSIKVCDLACHNDSMTLYCCARSN